MAIAEQTDPGERAKPSSSAVPVLGECEVGAIDIFVGAVRLLGLPKSVGEIYGLLFMSPAPLPLDGIMERLQMSKGSASQGLKFLRNVGAVRPVYVAGERRDHYEAVIELKPLVSGFIREELMPHMAHGEIRLARLAEVVATDDGGNEVAQHRLGRLQQWHRSAQEVLPLVRQMLDQLSSENEQ